MYLENFLSLRSRTFSDNSLSSFSGHSLQLVDLSSRAIFGCYSNQPANQPSKRTSQHNHSLTQKSCPATFHPHLYFSSFWGKFFLLSSTNIFNCQRLPKSGFVIIIITITIDRVRMDGCIHTQTFFLAWRVLLFVFHFFFTKSSSLILQPVFHFLLL